MQSSPILLYQNFLYYPRPMYPGNHGDSQFCPFCDCFANPQNEAMLAAKSEWTLGQAHMKEVHRWSRWIYWILLQFAHIHSLSYNTGSSRPLSSNQSSHIGINKQTNACWSIPRSRQSLSTSKSVEGLKKVGIMKPLLWSTV